MKKRNYIFILIFSLIIILPGLSVDAQTKTWRSAYKEFLENNPYEYVQLVYLNNDKIPEMVTNNYLISFINGRLIECPIDNIGGAYYVPKKNVFMLFGGGAGSEYNYYKYNSKTGQLDLFAHIESWYMGASSNEGKFYFNDESITENEFKKYVNIYKSKYKTKYIELVSSLSKLIDIDYDEVYTIVDYNISKFEKKNNKLRINSSEILVNKLVGGTNNKKTGKKYLELKLSKSVKYSYEFSMANYMEKRTYKSMRKEILNASPQVYPDYVYVYVKNGKIVKVTKVPSHA